MNKRQLAKVVIPKLVPAALLGLGLFDHLESASMFVNPAMSGPGIAQAQTVTIRDVKKKFDARTRTFTYTVRIRNTGRIRDVFVTAQPYNDKTRPENDPNRPPMDAAQKQKKKVTLGGEQTTTVTFTFTGADGKDWKSKYTDIYDGDPDNPDPTKRGRLIPGAADIGLFSFLEVPPGPALAALAEFQFPFPDPIAILDVGSASFFIDVIEQSLPPGWVISAFDPSPGSSFTLDLGQVMPVSVAITSATPISIGEAGFVAFDFVQPDSGVRIRSEVGVKVVPEPSTLFLFASGLASLAWPLRARSTSKKLAPTHGRN